VRNLTKTLAAVSLLAPASAFPLGIEGIKLHSALNQNLHAEIGLVLLPGENPDNITVNLAPPEKFDKAGVPWTYFLSKIKFETVESNGDVKIRLTSKEPLKEPFLNFLLEVNWPKGSLYREFTVLVDPPSFKDQPAAPVYAQPTAYPYPQQLKHAQPQPAPRAAARRTRTPSVDLSAGQYGPTTRNDTLWKIAERVSRQTGVSIEQTMMGLYEANPRAFYKPNVNALLAGKTLTIPDREVFLKLSRQQAIDLFTQQNLAWQHRTVPPKTVASPEIQPEHTESQLKLVAPKQEEASAKETVPSGVQPNDAKRAEEIAVATPDPSEKGAEAVAGVQDQVLADKIANLEKQLAEMQKLIVLRNQELAALQKQLSATEGQIRLPEPVGAEEKIDKKPVVQAPKPGKAITNQKALPETDDTWGGLSYLLAGLGAGLLAYSAWVYWRRRTLDTNGQLGEAAFSAGFQSSKKPSEIFHASGLKEDAVSKDDLNSESLFGSDFAVSDFDVFDIDQAEIDPVSEADVYMAYGRYQQAEELIRLAINDQPERDDYKLKLLEIFFASENKQAFENYATLLSSTGKNIDTVFWEKVTEMGGEICPGSPLFSNAVQNSVKNQTNNIEEPARTKAEISDSLFDDVDFDLTSFDQLFAKTDQDSTKVDSQPGFGSAAPLSKPTDKELAFDHDDEPKANNEPIDFNLMAFSTGELNWPGTEKATAPDANENDKKNGVPAFSMAVTENLELSQPGGIKQKDSTAFSLEKPITLKDRITKTDLDDDFDFSSALNQFPNRDNGSNIDFANLNEMNELEIQLDLALAYVDMGDNNAAKEIANQVLKSGNQEQQMVAKSILEKL